MAINIRVNKGIEIKTVTEYVLVYARDKSNCKISGKAFLIINGKVKKEKMGILRRSYCKNAVGLFLIAVFQKNCKEE